MCLFRLQMSSSMICFSLINHFWDTLYTLISTLSGSQSRYFNYCSATLLLVKYFHKIPSLERLRLSEFSDDWSASSPTIALSFRLAEEYCRCKSATRHIRNSICVAQENKRDSRTRICYFPLFILVRWQKKNQTNIISV